jgi:hypothetical protein
MTTWLFIGKKILEVAQDAGSRVPRIPFASRFIAAPRHPARYSGEPQGRLVIPGKLGKLSYPADNLGENHLGQKNDGKRGPDCDKISPSFYLEFEVKAGKSR